MEHTDTRPLAMVTGASSGIGAGFVRALVGRGYRVLAVARRGERLDALQTELGTVVPLVADLAAPGATAEVLRAAADLGPVELVVANAGRGIAGPFRLADPAELTDMVQLNVIATTELVRGLLPGMIERRSGGLLLVSSVGGLEPTPWMAAYGGTKAYLAALGQALAEELRGSGVRVTTVCPGPTVTEFDVAAGLPEGAIAAAPGALDVDRVVSDALDGWARGRDLVVPGRFYAVMTAMLRRLPRRLAVRLQALGLGEAAGGETHPVEMNGRVVSSMIEQP